MEELGGVGGCVQETGRGARVYLYGRDVRKRAELKGWRDTRCLGQALGSRRLLKLSVYEESSNGCPSD
eukprot:5914111-Pyramimonas_sp.AAC.2